MLTLNDGKKNTNMLSDMIGGCQVDLISNLTTGDFRWDILRYGLSRIGCETDVVKTGRSHINNFFATSSTEARIMLILHSEGAINGKNILKKGLPKEIQQRIWVLAIAPGAFIDREYCKQAFHYTSANGFVCHLDPARKERNRNNFNVLEPHKDANVWDHSFDSPTFTEIIEGRLNDFLHKRGMYE